MKAGINETEEQKEQRNKNARMKPNPGSLERLTRSTFGENEQGASGESLKYIYVRRLRANMGQNDEK